MKPLRAFVAENRETLTPEEMPAMVDHYSIPALDAGAPEPVESSTIDSHKIDLRGGELLISRLNPRKPRVHLTPPTLASPSVASTEFVTLRVRSGDARYLRYRMLAEDVRQDLDSKVRSATRSHQRVEPGEILSTLVPVSSETDQRRIADFLDDRVARIDQIITARHRQAKACGALSYSTMSGILDAAGAASGWVPLRRLSDGIEQGGSPIAEDRVAGPGEVGILKTSAIQRGYFRPANHKAIGAEQLDPSHQVHDGDLLVTRGSGSADLVGDAAVVEIADTPLYLSDLTYRVRGLAIDPHFACFSILSARGRAELGARVRQGSGPAKARGEDVLALPVPVLGVREQAELVAEIRRVSLQDSLGQQALVESTRLLREYKQSLITAAVTGKIDVTTAGSGIPS